MDKQSHPDYTCTKTRDGDFHCEHKPELSNSGQIFRDCRRGQNMVSPSAFATKVVESYSHIDIPEEPIEVAAIGEEIDPTIQLLKLVGCAAMVGREGLRSGNDMWYLNYD